MLETVLLFLLINWNPSLAIVYFAMSLVSIQIFVNDSNVSYPLNRPSISWTRSLFYALLAYLFFRVTFSVVADQLGFLGVGQTFSQLAIETFAETKPILTNSASLTFLSFTFLIPIIESVYFFLRLNEKVQEWSKLSFANFGVGTIIVFLFISAVFTVFHISAKGITNTSSLFMTFYFALISMFLVYKDRDGKSAVLFHVLTNGLAVLKLQGYLKLVDV